MALSVDWLSFRVGFLNVPSKNMSCAGCHEAIRGNEYLKYSKCQSVYDLVCVNVINKRFTSFYSLSTTAGRVGRHGRVPGTYAAYRRATIRESLCDLTNDADSLPPATELSVTHSPTDNVTQRVKPRVDSDIIKLIKTEIQAAVRSELA